MDRLLDQFCELLVIEDELSSFMLCRMKTTAQTQCLVKAQHLISIIELLLLPKTILNEEVPKKLEMFI